MRAWGAPSGKGRDGYFYGGVELPKIYELKHRQAPVWLSDSGKRNESKGRRGWTRDGEKWP